MGLSAILGLGLPLICKLVEKRFGKGGGKDKKLPLAMSIVKQIVGSFAEPGTGLPEDAEITQMIEDVVAQLNKSGVLAGDDTVLEQKQIDQFLFSTGMELIRRSGALKGQS
jgi:hypothetical protein